MRTASATDVKKNRENTHLEPDEGSRVHRMWQRFKQNPAEPVFVHDLDDVAGTALEQLRNFYGLDIRQFDRHKPRKYWLVGEWFGKTYVDYIAARREREEKLARNPPEAP